MDYQTLFTPHLEYECITHKVRYLGKANLTDAPEWVAVSVLQKHLRELNA